MLKKEELRRLFVYRDGALYYRHSAARPIHIGQKAGTPSGTYTRIEINKKRYSAQVLIWIYHKGDIPEGWRVRRIKDTSDAISNLKLEAKRCGT